MLTVTNAILRVTGALALVLIAVAPGAASAAEPVLSSEARSIVFVNAIVEKGSQCGLLAPWQAMTLRSQAFESARRWDGEKRRHVAQASRERADQLQCDDAGMNLWITGSSKGFESEMLPPFLIIYRAMAVMEEPPAVFGAISLRMDHASAVAAIDAHLAALAASGAKAEGGAAWPAYIEGISAQAKEFAAAMETGELPGRYTLDQAASYLAQSALVTELWLAEHATPTDEGGMEQ